jgi:hypothetical protein
MMVSGYKLPRQNEHREHPTPQGDAFYREGRFPPLMDFVKSLEDGRIKCPTKYRVSCKREDDLNNSLQIENWHNVALKCFSNHLDDMARKVHEIQNKLELYIKYLVGIYRTLTSLESDVSKLNTLFEK